MSVFIAIIPDKTDCSVKQFVDCSLIIIFKRIFKLSTQKQQLDKLIKHENIINYIKAQRLRLFGHVQRTPDNRTVKKILIGNP